MRTKTLLCLAALAAGAVTSMAQSNVYSLNVVGYVNTVINPGYTLISNPLNTTNNTILGLFGGSTSQGGALPDGTQVYLWSGASYNIGSRDDLIGDANGWDNNFETNNLPPGIGAFILNGGATPFTITFVGEVMQGSLSNYVNSGYAMLGSQVPQQGQLDTDLAFPAVDGDQIYLWSNSGKQYTIFSHDSLLNVPPPWGPTPPVLSVGQGFFSFKTAAVGWVRTFTVQ